MLAQISSRGFNACRFPSIHQVMLLRSSTPSVLMMNIIMLEQTVPMMIPLSIMFVV